MVIKPPTLKANSIKEWVRVHFLSPFLHDIPKNEKTLDLACGWGFSFKINPNFYGIEYDEKCFNYLKDNYNVKRGSLLEPLPYEDNFFDNVFSHDVLEHFEPAEVEVIFKNVHRVLKKGGRFINIIPNRLGYDFGFKIDAGHKHFIVPTEIKALADKYGFNYQTAYASPLPKAFDGLFTHNKWVTTCIKE